MADFNIVEILSTDNVGLSRTTINDNFNKLQDRLDNLEVSIPLTFPTATGVKGQWAVDLINKLYYFCIATNTWIKWTIETV